MAEHQFDVDELTLILDNLQANIQAENQELIKIYELKKKACEEAARRLKIQNQLLNEIRKLREQNDFILKAIRASHTSLRHDHYLLIELIKSKQNGNSQNRNDGGRTEAHLLEEIKARQSVNFNFDLPKSGDSTTIQTGDRTNLDFAHIGGNKS